MPDLRLITEAPLPKGIHGSFSRYSLSSLEKAELLEIEDQLFKAGHQIKIPESSCCVVIPDISDALVEEAVVLSEFALALLTTEGHPAFRFAALFDGAKCTQVKILPERLLPAPVFVSTIKGKAAAQWLNRCMLSKANLKDRLHVTARRYVRFATSTNDADRLLDLCISLESLLDSQTEVSFRFGVLLAKVCNRNGAEARSAADLLSQLYEIRSKLAHGDPSATALVKKLEPKLVELRSLANRILTIYVLYTSQRSRTDWKEHLKKSLFE